MPVDYLERARALGRAEFIAQHPNHFLLKRPKKNAVSGTEPSKFGFATVAAKMDVDPFAGQWQILPVVKRADNPFPERLTVGRTPNCDIVLRLPFISKVHAHIICDENGKLSIQDNKSSQSTFHNHRKLAPGDAPRPLAVGDFVGFGTIEFEFVDAGRLYDVLRAEA